MTTHNSAPPPSDDDNDDSTQFPHPEHAAISKTAILVWRRIAEMVDVDINGNDACEVIDILIHAFYDQRQSGLNTAADIVSDFSDANSAEADESRDDPDKFSTDRIAIFRERAAALELAGFAVFRHNKEMIEDHEHFDEKNSEKIEEISNGIVKDTLGFEEMDKLREKSN